MYEHDCNGDTDKDVDENEVIVDNDDDDDDDGPISMIWQQSSVYAPMQASIVVAVDIWYKDVLQNASLQLL